MLAELGFDSLESLVAAVLPAIRDERLRLPDPCTESEVLTELRGLAARNQVSVPLIGMGYYGTETPAVIRRRVLENPAWYTAYTPYQPEISQGRLEALLNFQTMIADLTGLPVSNASLLDEPTAAAEAMGWPKAPADRHPTSSSSTRTPIPRRSRCSPPAPNQWASLDIRDVLRDGLPDDAFGLLLSYPWSLGRITDLTDIIAAAKERGMVVAVATDLLALTILTPPGDFGADIAIGSAQRFGVPMGMGGPHAGFMSVREGLERTLPGRLVGVSVDADGRPALRLALQTREQHIRRDRATSNICTSQVLLAVIAGAYAVYHGPDGLRGIAERAHSHAYALAQGLRAGGIDGQRGVLRHRRVPGSRASRGGRARGGAARHRGAPRGP